MKAATGRPEKTNSKQIYMSYQQSDAVISGKEACVSLPKRVSMQSKKLMYGTYGTYGT